MTSKIIRCSRCKRRYRGQGGWNNNTIAGLVIEMLCPDCQTPQEDLEAELNLITAGPMKDMYVGGSDVGSVANYAEILLRSYHYSPELMRDKAGQLEAARRDPYAKQVVRLLRRLADAMESGELYEITS
ncbi:MAG: hypothetical protein ACLQGN_30840 [Mycobacterium sp.]|uniref:hypothetical protein n=1 Tax=Mycobacterium sp. TaxID=1785 RepID=UPI003F949C92